MSRLFRSVLRHILGVLVFLPLLVGAIVVQAVLGNGVFRNQTAIPGLIYRACGWFLGVHFSLNPISAPVSEGNVTMFVANHLARYDFVGLHLFPNAVVMVNARVFEMPVWGSVIKIFASSSGFIPTRQSKDGKHMELDQLAQAAQEGRNAFVFPEGIQSDGRRVLRYSEGSAEIFYDKELLAKYPALRTAQLQPVVLRVKTIDGENVMDQPSKWEPYALTHQLSNPILALSRLLTTGSVTVDTLICPPLDPREFDTAADLINAAHELTRSIVAPDQTEALTRKQWKERLLSRDFSL
ncbi:lysophospholipid acyltransferase family protein [Marimonas sp. MJW-29]|uniref:Lysophospholipid acyltransferase family protein n=1 Tax=Sulfitobacter sediminis TaxID=3234186 RepID=A0ABV3RT52_9RHOB